MGGVHRCLLGARERRNTVRERDHIGRVHKKEIGELHDRVFFGKHTVVGG